MPKATDSDNQGDRTIVFTENTECPSCETIIDVDYDTGAYDEDGLAVLEPGDLVVAVTCPGCGEEFESTYMGWSSYGSA